MRLREMRRHKFLSQEELAKKAGVAASTVAKVEQGTVVPQPRTARKLAAALGVEPDTIDWPERPDAKP